MFLGSRYNKKKMKKLFFIAPKIWIAFFWPFFTFLYSAQTSVRSTPVHILIPKSKHIPTQRRRVTRCREPWLVFLLLFLYLPIYCCCCWKESPSESKQSNNSLGILLETSDRGVCTYLLPILRPPTIPHLSFHAVLCCFPVQFSQITSLFPVCLSVCRYVCMSVTAFLSVLCCAVVCVSPFLISSQLAWPAGWMFYLVSAIFSFG